MSAPSLEEVRDKVAAYIMTPNLEGRTVLDLAPGFGRIYGIAELAQKAGVSASMLGKIRKSYRSALAQALTPGQPPRCEVVETKLYGRTAISIRVLASGG